MGRFQLHQCGGSLLAALADQADRGERQHGDDQATGEVHDEEHDAGAIGILAPVFQQGALVVQHRKDARQHLVHGVEAGIRPQRRQQFLLATGLLQGDGLLHLLDLALYQRLQRLQACHLFRVIRDQALQIGPDFIETATAGLVVVQIGPVAGQQEAALAAFGPAQGTW